MSANPKLPFVTLLLLISFASVNAVLFTPALTDIALFFDVSEKMASFTISGFLIGYALGQLIYGPLANRYGRKKALYIGISVQMLSCLGCILAGYLEIFTLLLVSRFFLALGSGVGLKMTFTLVNERYEPIVASQKISHLLFAFAITPGLAVALGGFLNTHFGWESCFWMSMVYGGILLKMCKEMSITETSLDKHALQWPHLRQAYSAQLKNSQLITGGLLMGGATCFVYLFAAIAPFIAMNEMGMESDAYGLANIIPSLGLLIGSIWGGYLVKKHALSVLIRRGIFICSVGVLMMITAFLLKMPALVSLFVPMMIIYIGLSLVLANASTLAMSHVQDKAHGSALMNFINMGLATVLVLCLSGIQFSVWLLPMLYLALCLLMSATLLRLSRHA